MVNTLNKTRDKHAKGQVIILLTLVFVALIAFLGLVIDGGIVLTRYAQLRRTVDAGAVQASNQFREFRPVYAPGNADGDMYSAVVQVAAAQGFIAQGYSGTNSTFYVYACTGPGPSIVSGPPQSPADYPAGITTQLCTPPPRKLVRVDGEINVGFAFLSVLGWRNVTLRATGIAEAAALDLVLVLDRSASMVNDVPGTDPTVCGPAKTCRPFEDVRTNAYNLVNKLYFPYDRVAIVTFSRKVLIYDHALGNFRQLSGITDTGFLNGTLMISDKGEALGVLNDNTKFNIDTCVPPCTGNTMPGTGYTANTNTGGAIRVATSTLAVQGRLRGAVWMMLLLSDGTPNATDPWGQFTGGFCPPTTWAAGRTYTVPGYLVNTAPSFPYAHSYCRRVNASDGGAGNDPDLPYNQITRACLYVPAYVGGPLPKCAPGTTITDTERIVSLADPPYYPRYDAADYMRDQADYMSANGIVAFVIGLGNEVSNNQRQWSTYKYIQSGGANSTTREANAGERLLRYVSDAGSQPNTWQCHSNNWDAGQTEFTGNAATDHHCGNYWFAAGGSSLQPIFDAIANRIFTRITQ